MKNTAAVSIPDSIISSQSLLSVKSACTVGFPEQNRHREKVSSLQMHPNLTIDLVVSPQDLTDDLVQGDYLASALFAFHSKLFSELKLVTDNLLFI